MPNGTPKQFSDSLNISSQTLFHFTNTKENLLNILRNDFCPHYSLEHWKYYDVAIPMVSFCDLPLSLTRRHLNLYGGYGIGLRKEWGRRNHLSPVLYHHDLSPVNEALRAVQLTWRKLGGLSLESDKTPVGKAVGEQMDKLMDAIITTLSFQKQYEGISEKDPEKGVICFYDEREWRYVPSIKTVDSIHPLLTIEGFRDGHTKSEEEAKLENWKKLTFTPDDIKFVVVRSENDILDFVQDIRGLKGKKYTWESVELLTTRIVSANKIEEDF